MSDMTQPEKDPQIQPQSSGEPTHIGIARYKDARESFLPQPPQDTTDTALDATIRPVDRSSVEKIHSQIDEITAKQAAEQKEESESFEFLGETRREKSGRFPLKRTIAGGLGVLAVTAAGFLGFNKIRSGEDGSERPGVIITDPTRDTTELTPTFTPEATPETEPEKTEKSPYEFGFELKIGEATIRVEDRLQTRTECPNTITTGQVSTLVPCAGIKEYVWDEANYPNLPEVMNTAKERGFYIAWRNQDESRKNVTFEDYKNKLANGEDLSFILPGFRGDKALPTDIVVNPSDKVFYDYIAQPASLFKPYSSLGISYRKVNDELHIEQYLFYPVNKDRMNPGTQMELKHSAILTMFGGLMYMSDVSNLRNGNLNKTGIGQYYDIGIEIYGDYLNEIEAIQIHFNDE